MTPLKLPARWLLAVGLALAVALPAGAADPAPVKTSVYSRVDPGYKRKQLKNGTFEREYYAISNGGLLAGTRRDEGLEKVDFPSIAGVVAEHLAKQDYFLARDSKSATLLLAIYWGRTIPFNDTNYSAQVNQAGTAVTRAQGAIRAEQAAMGASAATPEATAQNVAILEAARMERALAMDALQSEMVAIGQENRARDQINAANASLLGYIDDLNGSDSIARFAGSPTYQDLTSDIESSRYYVVVMAYDFKRLVERKERKLQWVTRISISVSGNQFQDRLDEMIARAGRYFGRNSRGLVREYEGTVEFGEAEVIGYDEADGDKPVGDAAGEAKQAPEN
jgi:hypothetical protein